MVSAFALPSQESEFYLKQCKREDINFDVKCI